MRFSKAGIIAHEHSLDVKNMEIFTRDMHTSPEDIGFDGNNIPLLDSFYQQRIEQDEIQCAGYLLARQHHLIAHKTMGKLRYNDENSHFQPDSLRYIASITKIFTALSILKLSEKGRLALDTPVAAFIEEFDVPYYSNINIFHLLTHTSGIRPEIGYFGEPYKEISRLEDLPHDPHWITRILEGPKPEKPGISWIYSSFGYMILGEIIRRITGKSFAQYLTETFLHPLEMNETFIRVPEDQRNRVALVSKEEGARLNASEAGYDILLPAGGISEGLYTTLSDLFKFAQFILSQGAAREKRLLSRKTLEAFARAHVNCPAYLWGKQKEKWQFGLGISVFDGIGEILSPGTLSALGAGRCGISIDPRENLIFIFTIPSPKHVADLVSIPHAIVWSGLL